ATGLTLNDLTLVVGYWLKAPPLDGLPTGIGPTSTDVADRLSATSGWSTYGPELTALYGQATALPREIRVGTTWSSLLHEVDTVYDHTMHILFGVCDLIRRYDPRATDDDKAAALRIQGTLAPSLAGTHAHYPDEAARAQSLDPLPD